MSSIRNALSNPNRRARQLADFVRYARSINAFVQASFRSSESWGASGSVQEPEYPLIRKLCEEASCLPGPIIEIGTLFGFTTTQLALWKGPSKEILTVDNYRWNPCGLPPDRHYQLTSRVLDFLIQNGHVQQLHLDKDEFYRTYDGGPPAMVFLDAVHTYEETKKDIEWALHADAAIISGHDYSEEWGGVRKAVDEFGGPAELLWSTWVLARRQPPLEPAADCAEAR